VVTEKGQVHGTLKGQGTPQCKVDYVAFEEKVEPGEWVYTSGDDRIFPRGFPVGIVKAVRPGQPFKEILVEPSGMQRGLVEDVLILIEGVHQPIPDAPPGMQPIYIASPPPGNNSTPASAAPSATGTEADRLRAQYQALGEEQKHTYGENPPGTKPADFTRLGNPGAAGPVGYPLGPAGKNPAPPNAPAPTNAEAGKNSPPAPGSPTMARPAAPAKNGTGGTAGYPLGPTGKNPPAPAAAPPKTATPPNAEAGKNSPPAPGSSPVARPAAPPKSGTGGTGLAPDKSAPPLAGTPAVHPPDAARRLNPPAGIPPGGQLR
jgi:rod shape-determining protein MreC